MCRLLFLLSLLLPNLWVSIFAQDVFQDEGIQHVGESGPDPEVVGSTLVYAEAQLEAEEVVPYGNYLIEGRIADLEQEVTQLKDALLNCVTFANEHGDIKIKGKLIFENTITQQQWIVGQRDSDHFAINKNNGGGLLIESFSNPTASTSQASPEVDTPTTPDPICTDCSCNLSSCEVDVFPEIDVVAPDYNEVDVFPEVDVVAPDQEVAVDYGAAVVDDYAY
jgi:hypothetical protein